jgi:hypothetical protein
VPSRTVQLRPDESLRLVESRPAGATLILIYAPA